MQVSAEQLTAHLRRGLAPVYLVYGDEPLLADECCDAIRQAAHAAGFGERQVFTVDPGFDWNALYDATQSLSLFAERRLVELRLPGGKPGEAGARILAELAERPPPDVLLLVSSGKLDRQVRASKWAKALEKAGVAVVVYPVEARALPGWIERRMAARRLKAGPGVAQLMAHHFEGNLLACAQEIDKLALSFQGRTVSVDDIEGNLGENARFTVFSLADACLDGNAAAIVRVLGALRAEGVEAVLVLWALAREARAMAELGARVTSGASPAAVIDAAGVWARRKPLVTRALKRSRVEEWQELLQRAAHADRVIKGRRRGDAWHELECLALMMGGTRLGTCGC